MNSTFDESDTVPDAIPHVMCIHENGPTDDDIDAMAEAAGDVQHVIARGVMGNRDLPILQPITRAVRQLDPAIWGRTERG